MLQRICDSRDKRCLNMRLRRIDAIKKENAFALAAFPLFSGSKAELGSVKRSLALLLSGSPHSHGLLTSGCELL